MGGELIILRRRYGEECNKISFGDGLLMDEFALYDILSLYAKINCKQPQ